MPRRIPKAIPAVSISDIWDYATRELTGSLDPTEAEIWAHVARTLTDPASYMANVSALALEVSAVNKEHETEWITDPVVDNVTSAALSTLTEHTILAADFTYPVGATERRVLLLAMLNAQAQGDATHHIGVKVQREVDDGGWGDLLDLTSNPPLGLSAEASMGNLALPIDITALVASGNKLEFRFQVDSDDATSVNYTTSFVIVLVYRMAT